MGAPAYAHFMLKKCIKLSNFSSPHLIKVSKLQANVPLLGKSTNILRESCVSEKHMHAFHQIKSCGRV